MKKLIYILIVALLGVIILFSCRKEDDKNIDLMGSITSIVPETAGRGEEVTLKLEFNYSNPSYDLEVFVDGIPVEIISIKGNEVVIKLPDYFINADIDIINADGCKIGRDFYKKGISSISSISPTTGKEGTIVNLTGYDLYQCPNDSLFVQLNGSLCEILSKSDTLITVKVPKNAGNGYFKVFTNSDVNSDCYRKEIKSPDFTYEFETTEQMWVSKLTTYTNIVTEYKRDESMRVIEAITEYKDDKKIFVYGTDGLLDTVYEYDLSSNELYGYWVYYLDNYPDVIEKRFYQPIPNHVNILDKEVYTYSNGQLNSMIQYSWEDTAYEQSYSMNYTYVDNRVLSYRNNINNDEWVYDLESKAVDLNIPGMEYIHLYNIVYDDRSGRVSYLYYNDYGYLSEIKYGQDRLSYLKYEYDYKEGFLLK